MGSRVIVLFVRRVLIRVLTPILSVLGARLRRRNKLGYAEYQDVFSEVVAGDVIVTRRRGIVSWLIPGYWSHAAMYVGNGYVTHAVYPKVEKINLADLVMSNNAVGLLRARFANDSQREAAVFEINGYIGEPYDLGFGPSKQAFYCSEAIWHAYKEAVPSWGFNARVRLGLPTVTPQDLWDADKHFDKVAF